jgi:transglutaminase-like putative cysteine protease
VFTVLIRIGYELVFEVPAPTPMLLMLHVRPEETARLGQPEWIRFDPLDIQMHTFIDPFGNRAGRIVAPAGKVRISYDNVVADSGLHEPKIDGARLHPVPELPDECMPFMLGSRYCEVDKLSQMAWDLFGKTPLTSERVQAVMDWAHSHIQFGYEHARPTKTAADACAEGKGVCRDFQHLAITMLRALNIPARYATGYLGDIGVPTVPLPMDFSAWFQVFLGGKWYTLDARHHEPRIGRVLMAVGRDATDVALTTTFGLEKLVQFKVWTDEVGPDALAQLPPPLPPTSAKVEFSAFVPTPATAERI